MKSGISLLFGHICVNTWHVKPEVMQEKVYKKRIKDIDELRAHIMTAWDKISALIDKAVRQWCTRLRAYIKAKGGHRLGGAGCCAILKNTK